MTTTKDKALGALLGLAVSDALGTTLEFSRPAPAPWLPLLKGPHTEIIGGGPFGVGPGQTTDDTMMSCCLASSLKAKDGFDFDDVAERYINWRQVTFDCGSQTGQSLSAYRDNPECPGKVVWDRSGRNMAGNGSLMRTAPIGVFFSGDPEAIVEVSILDSSITHFDPRCMLACAALNSAIGYAVATDMADISELGAVVDEALRAGVKYLHNNWNDMGAEISFAFADLMEDLEMASRSDPEMYGPQVNIYSMQGFVRVAFRLAFWTLLHSDSFEAGLTHCVNQGGDSDTNGAITGSLLGAVYGESGIPDRWKNTVLGFDKENSPFGKNGLYHPLRLLEMVGY